MAPPALSKPAWALGFALPLALACAQPRAPAAPVEPAQGPSARPDPAPPATPNGLIRRGGREFYDGRALLFSSRATAHHILLAYSRYGCRIEQRSKYTEDFVVLSIDTSLIKIETFVALINADPRFDAEAILDEAVYLN